MSRFVVYRMYDADENLIYVGRTARGFARVDDHRTQTPWWDEVDIVTVEHFPDAISAEYGENDAIWNEHPRYNRLGHVQDPRMRDLLAISMSPHGDLLTQEERDYIRDGFRRESSSQYAEASR